MLDAVAENLSQAITLAISPLPLIGLIVLVIAGNRAAAWTWTFGWFAAIVVGVGVFTIGGRSTSASDVADDSGVNWLAFVLAAIFFLLAWHSFSNRPAPGVEAEEPSWISALGSMSVIKVFGLAVLLMGLNPKNLPIYAAIAGSLSSDNLATGDAVIAVLIIALIGTATAIVVCLIELFGGESAAQMLRNWRAWLVQNNAGIMAVLFLLLGIGQLSTALQSV